MRTILSIFLALHGLVHIWFIVLSEKLVPFEKEMGWTGQSWLLSNVLPNSTLRTVATILFSISTLLFIVGSILFALKSDPAKTFLILGSIISSLTLIVFWDGSFEMIVQKGIIGLIINIVTIIYFIN